MKVTLSEAMKKVSILNQYKQEIRNDENKNKMIRYSTLEIRKELLDNNVYDYDNVTSTICEVNNLVLEIKGKILEANSKIMLDNYEFCSKKITIGQALIRLAQLDTDINRFQSLKIEKNKSSNVTYGGVIEYSETMYDPEEAKVSFLDAMSEKASLQAAIDRANLMNYIEIPENRFF